MCVGFISNQLAGYFVCNIELRKFMKLINVKKYVNSASVRQIYKYYSLFPHYSNCNQCLCISYKEIQKPVFAQVGKELTVFHIPLSFISKTCYTTYKNFAIVTANGCGYDCEELSVKIWPSVLKIVYYTSNNDYLCCIEL